MQGSRLDRRESRMDLADFRGISPSFLSSSSMLFGGSGGGGGAAAAKRWIDLTRESGPFRWPSSSRLRGFMFLLMTDGGYEYATGASGDDPISGDMLARLLNLLRVLPRGVERKKKRRRACVTTWSTSGTMFQCGQHQ